MVTGERMMTVVEELSVIVLLLMALLGRSGNVQCPSQCVCIGQGGSRLRCNHASVSSISDLGISSSISHLVDIL